MTVAMAVVNFVLLVIGVAQVIVAQSQVGRALGLTLAAVAGASTFYFARLSKRCQSAMKPSSERAKKVVPVLVEFLSRDRSSVVSQSVRRRARSSPD